MCAFLIRLHLQGSGKRAELPILLLTSYLKQVSICKVFNTENASFFYTQYAQ